ncbi:hypothetical protein SSX86_032158 [Deinandra increscens subsp. villosa]|uniref:Uncharacterized protein n=1 Tax=Deinandra increscens subsp. villosa TaxID=3103831 RepID=A0AAP0C7T8_9ASTR
MKNLEDQKKRGNDMKKEVEITKNRKRLIGTKNFKAKKKFSGRNISKKNMYVNYILVIKTVYIIKFHDIAQHSIHAVLCWTLCEMRTCYNSTAQYIMLCCAVLLLYEYCVVLDCMLSKNEEEEHKEPTDESTDDKNERESEGQPQKVGERADITAEEGNRLPTKAEKDHLVVENIEMADKESAEKLNRKSYGFVEQTAGVKKGADPKKTLGAFSLDITQFRLTDTQIEAVIKVAEKVKGSKCNDALKDNVRQEQAPAQRPNKEDVDVGALIQKLPVLNKDICVTPEQGKTHIPSKEQTDEESRQSNLKLVVTPVSMSSFCPFEKVEVVDNTKGEGSSNVDTKPRKIQK